MIRPMVARGQLLDRHHVFWKRFPIFALSLLALLVFVVSLSQSYAKETSTQSRETKKNRGEVSWEMPGRVSIYDLEFGQAVYKDNLWQLQSNGRTFNSGSCGGRLTLMVKFSYSVSQAEVPLKFVVKLPNSRQYEETVRLEDRRGNYSYCFTVHHPEDFLGDGSVYIYYGFSIVDVLDFTIAPGS